MENKMKTKMECIECGHKFSKTISAADCEIKCPKCSGYDTEIN